jgi:hypothetical protein
MGRLGRSTGFEHFFVLVGLFTLPGSVQPPDQPSPRSTRQTGPSLITMCDTIIASTIFGMQLNNNNIFLHFKNVFSKKLKIFIFLF